MRHYTDDSDNPGYATTTTNDTTTNTWYGGSIGGDLAATVTGNQTVLSLIDPQGSAATSITLDGATDQVCLGHVGAYDEYGNTLATPDQTGPIAHGWLGGKERATDSSGLLLMGARLYNPTTGLFTSVDPVDGGNTTDYTYPQDPINNYDIDGRMAAAVLVAASAIGTVSVGEVLIIIGTVLIASLLVYAIWHSLRAAANKLHIWYAHKKGYFKEFETKERASKYQERQEEKGRP